MQFVERLEPRRLLSVAHPVEKLLLNDQFNGSTLNAANWGVYGGYSEGRSQMNTGGNISVKNGVANLTVSTYNPQDPGVSMTGSELDGKQSFALGQNGAFEYDYSIEAKFSSPLIAGLVGGMFMYSADQSVSHDEIDTEAITDQGVLPGTKTMDTNVFEANGTTRYVPVTLPKDFSFTNWHRYEMRWTTTGIEWLIDKKAIRVESYVATSPMVPIINLWAAQPAWNTAYNASLKPTANKASAKTYQMEIDSVEVYSLT